MLFNMFSWHFLYFLTISFQDFGQLLHSLGGRGLYYGDAWPRRGRRGRVGVDVVDGHSGAHALHEPGGGIDGQRRADDDENVGLIDCIPWQALCWAQAPGKRRCAAS